MRWAIHSFSVQANRGRRWGALLLALIFSLQFAAHTAAQIPAAPMGQSNGLQLQLPNTPGRYSRRSQLAVMVDPRWTNSFGYWPVEVTVTCAKASTSDRVITINLHSGWNRASSAEQSFVLPAGALSATTSVTLPVFQTPIQKLWWDLYVNGVKDKDLSIEETSSQAWSVNVSNSGAGVEVLVAGPSKMHRGLVSTSGMEMQVLSLKLSSFPTRWIDYTAFDVVSLSLSEVQQLVKTQPATWAAICDWVRAGGSLWISDAGQQLEHLPEISKLFKLPEQLVLNTKKAGSEQGDASGEGQDSASKNEGEVERTDTSEPEPPQPEEGWRSMRFLEPGSDGKIVTFRQWSTGRTQTVTDPRMIARMRNDANFGVVEERFDPAAVALPGSISARNSSKWFVEQNYGLGIVRAFRGANEAAKFPVSSSVVAQANQYGVAQTTAANGDPTEELAPALDVAIKRTRHWDNRHGMTPDSANSEFVKFMVPGVGKAPVTEFQVLITLFVLIIGPLNYWWLKRSRRLHLMVITVPLAALAMTAALFAYAVVADGFDTRVRALTYTKLDQKAGEAACWSRLSYYSGLSPGRGLTMPADVAMYPVLPAWAGDWGSGERRQIAWDGNQARLTQGWLGSRTPTQYLTVRSRKTPIKLDVLDSGSSLRIKNLLGAKIKTLVVVNAAGKFYMGEDIAVDATTPLKPTSRDDAEKKISKLITAIIPQAPPELGLSETDFAAMQSRSRYYGRYGVQYNASRLSENLAGLAITDLGGLNGEPPLQLPRQSYVAITETGPEVELGMTYAKEDSSFHLIEGRYY